MTTALANVLLALLAAEPGVNVVVTSGAQVNGSALSREVVPLVAVEAEAAGTFSGRLAVQVDARGLHDLGSFLDFTHRWSERLSLGVRLEPLTPSLHLVSFDWGNAIAPQPVDATFPTPVLTSTFVAGPMETFVSLRSGAMTSPTMTLVPFVDVVGGASVTFGRLSLGLRAAQLNTGFPRSPTFPDALRLWVAAAFVEASWGGGVAAPLDLLTNGADPRRYRALGPVDAGSGFGLTVRGEGGAGANLLISSTRVGELEPVPVGYADAQVRARLGWLQLFVIGRLASLSLVASPPAISASLSNRTPSPLVTEAPMLTGMGGVELSFGRVKPGLMLRVRQLAVRSIESFFGGNAPPPGGTPGIVRAVVDPTGVRTVMAPLLPQLAAKAFVRWSPESHLTLAVEADLEVDRNQYFVGGLGVAQRGVELRAQVLLQARL